jgi:hypothetical protein
MIPPEVQLMYICISASNLLDLLNGKSGSKLNTYISIGVGVALSVVIAIIVGRVVKKELDKMKALGILIILAAKKLEEEKKEEHAKEEQLQEDAVKTESAKEDPIKDEPKLEL